jgi:hypothetical protein
VVVVGVAAYAWGPVGVSPLTPALGAPSCG